MSYLHAIVLGIIQGLTEFLPVSSSGHLVLVQGWLEYDPKSPEMLAFDVVSHFGTLLAMAVVFRRPVRSFLTNRRYQILAGDFKVKGSPLVHSVDKTPLFECPRR